MSKSLTILSSQAERAAGGGVAAQIIHEIDRLSVQNATHELVQASVANITSLLLSTCFESPEDGSMQNRALVPVLRAGMAMWGSANSFFSYPQTSFLVASRDKDTGLTAVDWTKSGDIRGKEVVILDPIIATGDTLQVILGDLANRSEPPASTTVLACYAAPEGLETLTPFTERSGVSLIVGCLAQTVDSNGYLIPPTNGDMGDKLFGPLAS